MTPQLKSDNPNAKTRVTVMLEPWIVARLDEMAPRLGMSRSLFLNMMLAVSLQSSSEMMTRFADEVAEALRGDADA